MNWLRVAVGTPTSLHPQVPDFSELQGMYQVEVRRGPEYGYMTSSAGIRFCILEGAPPFGCGGRSFDTNDRLGQHVSLVAPSADQLRDGQTFQISDGVDTVVFEFEDRDVGDGVASGNLMVPFDGDGLRPGHRLLRG